MSQSYAPRTSSKTLRSILDVAADAWARSVDARFIREATDGTLRDDVFARYLRIERGFVQTSARVRAAAAFASPTEDALNLHRRAMNSLLDSQHPYLSAAIERLAIEPTPSPAADRSEELSRHVLRVARTRDYAQILIVMLAAEELYATWCSAAIRTEAPRNPLLTEWIELHVSPPFTDEVAELTAELDALHPSDSLVATLGACAAEVLDLEVTFHDGAYLPDEQPRTCHGLPR